MPFENDHSNHHKPFTIDRERDIILTGKPAGQDAVCPFFLKWHGQEVKFAGEGATVNRYKNEEGKWRFDLRWTIDTLVIPENFPERQDEIFKTISQALDAYGELHSRSRIGTVEVIFSKHPVTDEWYY